MSASGNLAVDNDAGVLNKNGITDSGMDAGFKADKVQYQQYLTFELSGEQYGVNILSVQEIKGWNGVRPVPDMPAYVPGVIDLRGIIVPIMDLRLRFDMQAKMYTETTVVIIVATCHENKVIPLGLVVDTVTDVLEVNANNIKSPPAIGENDGKRKYNYVRGLVSLPERMVVILDIEKLLNEKIIQGE